MILFVPFDRGKLLPDKIKGSDNYLLPTLEHRLFTSRDYGYDDNHMYLVYDEPHNNPEEGLLEPRIMNSHDVLCPNYIHPYSKYRT